MSDVLFHIGPHKTGSTYIQHMLKENIKLLPKDVQHIPKGDPLFWALATACVRYSTHELEKDKSLFIYRLAQELANNFHAPKVILSQENILSSLPSRLRLDYLYANAPEILAIIQKAFIEAGHNVNFVFYIREYRDWLHSLFHYTYRETPDRKFAPKHFKAIRNFPENWNGVKDMLTNAVGADNITFLSYEDCRATGKFGTYLFNLLGLKDETLDQFRWIPPVNVSRAETLERIECKD